MPLVIAGLFYGYTWIFKIESLLIDIIIFIISIIVAQIISYRIILVHFFVRIRFDITVVFITFVLTADNIIRKEKHKGEK